MLSTTPDDPHDTTTRAVHRDDGELVGVLIADGALWAPCTVFGHRLAEARPEDEAVDFLIAEGLGSLAGGWEFNDDGAWLNVQVVEANTTHVTVSFADYGRADLFGQRRTLTAPVGGRLRRRR